MVYFVKYGGTRLVQVKALGGEFPYYGKLETKPAEAGIGFRDTYPILVDKTLMMQFNAQVGDTIKIGNLLFRYCGHTGRGTWPDRPGFIRGSGNIYAPAIFIRNFIGTKGKPDQLYLFL